jgi:hypothetical protein
VCQVGARPRNAAKTALITNKTAKIKNEILAISTAALAMPPKPRTPAISANIKKLMDQASIAVSLACDAFV